MIDVASKSNENVYEQYYMLKILGKKLITHLENELHADAKPDDEQ